MKLFIALLAGILFLSTENAFSQRRHVRPIDFAGKIFLEMPFQQVPPQFKSACNPPGPPPDAAYVCEAMLPNGTPMIVMLGIQRARVKSILVIFPGDAYDQVRDALVKKFGKPDFDENFVLWQESHGNPSLFTSDSITLSRVNELRTDYAKFLKSSSAGEIRYSSYASERVDEAIQREKNARKARDIEEKL